MANQNKKRAAGRSPTARLVFAAIWRKATAKLYTSLYCVVIALRRAEGFQRLVFSLASGCYIRANSALARDLVPA